MAKERAVARSAVSSDKTTSNRFVKLIAVTNRSRHKHTHSEVNSSGHALQSDWTDKILSAVQQNPSSSVTRLCFSPSAQQA